MKISYKHIVRHIDSRPDINDLSEKLFQLGHEHEILDGIFDMEITPNRGDCLSLNGLLRDLRLFYDVSFNKDLYDKEISLFPFQFINEAKESCSNISFLKIDIDNIPFKYQEFLEDYFTDLNIKKINFFTDISNYLSYETGQPTHCYDSSSIDGPIKLKFLNKSHEFETLLDKKINIDSGNLVFSDKKDDVINFAGLIGGKNTACRTYTKSVIIECAHFDPEVIIGKSVKYDINSDAAHKFERNTDPCSHDNVLRRFLAIVESHSKIRNVQLFTECYQKKEKKLIPFNLSKINKVLGIKIDEKKCLTYLNKLDFVLKQDMIQVPTYRNDVISVNDISEEVARAIGYNNIQPKPINIAIKNNSKLNFEENKIKNLLVNKGFYEVINNPFSKENSKDSVLVDNPLDSNRKYLRTKLKDSLIDNLLFNERRQKETIKLFEISDLYSNDIIWGRRVIGIIASGRIGKNFSDFSKKIDKNYLKEILSKLKSDKFEIEEISRQSLDTKSKNTIIYSEIEINSIFAVDNSFEEINIQDINKKRYIPISEFPTSSRDLSFLIKDFKQCKTLEEFILNYKDGLLKEVFVFDYYKNDKMNKIKIGFRFIFQSKDHTITVKEVDNVMSSIIKEALEFDSISIPGIS